VRDDSTGLTRASLRAPCLNASGDSNVSARTKNTRPRPEGLQFIRGRATLSRGAKVQRLWNVTRTGHFLERHFIPHVRVSVCGRRLACLAALLLVVYFPLLNRAVYAGQSPTEYQVKAAYLFNFLKFVEWPDDPPGDPHGKWVIGFIGDSPIGGELARLVEGKNVLGRDLQIRKVLAADSARGCHILFISDSERNRLPSILADLNGSSVLTVADMENFISAGGMIQFVVEDARVRVAIDVGAASRAHLKVSSKLLSLARTVTGTQRGANN
jgi:hypothetical protein